MLKCVDEYARDRESVCVCVCVKEKERCRERAREKRGVFVRGRVRANLHIQNFIYSGLSVPGVWA